MLRNHCSHCGRTLSKWDKARSNDFGLLNTHEDGSIRPLCVQSAYEFAALYIKDNLDKIGVNVNGK